LQQQDPVNNTKVPVISPHLNGSIAVIFIWQEETLAAAIACATLAL
jgi:hypothetical protein